MINLPTLSVGASCHREQIGRNTLLKVPYFHHIVAQNYTIYILFIFNPVYIIPKSCKKSLRIEVKATDFSPLNCILRLIFIHIIQSFLYTICTNCTKIHTKKQFRKSEEKARLILSILIDFSTPQMRNGIPSRAKIHYNRKLKHAKYFL